MQPHLLSQAEAAEDWLKASSARADAAAMAGLVGLPSRVHDSCDAQPMVAIVWGMVAIRNRRGAQIAAFFALACIGLAAAGCGSSSPSTSSSKSQGLRHRQRGLRLVAAVPEREGGRPGVRQGRGLQVLRAGRRLRQLESDIASGEIHPNVFESVGGDNITPLFPKFTKWYVQYAGTSMVVAYNPKSKYASAVQGHRRRQQAAEGPVHPAGDAGPQARPDRSQHRPAGPGLHLHARAGADVLPPARGHGDEDPRRPGWLVHLVRRSTPSPRWTRRCSPASSTPPAPSSPRRSSCTWTTSRCRPPSTWASFAWRPQYAKTHRSRSPRRAAPRRPSTARRR